MKNVSVKLFSFFSGGIIGDQERVCQNFSFINEGSIGDQERVCQTLQLLYWREYWWSRTCLSNSSASLMEGVLVIKNVSVKLFSFINGGSIGDQERVCQTLQLLQRRDYLWPGTCLWNSSASSMDGVLVIKIASVKLFNFFSGGSIGDQERVCQNFSFINGGSIGDQERVCQTLQLLYWREYWWSRTCLSNSSASLMEGVLVIKNVSVKLFSFFNGGSIGDQNVSAKFSASSTEGVLWLCQTLQLLQWRQYWWSRTCLSNSSASSMEGVLVMKNVSVKLFSFFSGGIIGDQERVCQNFSFINGGSIGDQERVCQTLQLLQWREYWWSRTCLSNSSASLMEGVLVIKNVSVKLFSFLMEGVLVIKNVSVKLFSFINGGSIGDEERVCQTLQLLQWRSIGDQELTVKLSASTEGSVCQTLQLLQWRVYWWSRTCLSKFQLH